MSPDRCTLCGIGRVTDPLCREQRCMPSVEELRPTSPDRIAQLTAELAKTRETLDQERNGIAAMISAHERTKARLAEVDLERAQLLVERDKRKGRRLSDGTEVAVGQRVVTVREACERHHLVHAHDEWVHEVTSLLGGDTGLVECGPRQIYVGHLQLAPAGSEITCPQCRGWREFMAKMRADADAHRAAQFKHAELTAELSEAWKALGTTAEQAADDPETAALADSIGVSLQYERDQVAEAREQLEAERAAHERTKVLNGSASRALADRRRREGR